MPAAASLPLPQLVLRRVVCQHAYDASSSLSSARSPLPQRVCPHNAASAWQWLVLRRVWVALAKACPAPNLSSRLGGNAMPHHSAPQGDRLCGRLAATKLHTQVTPRRPLSPWRVPTDRRLHNLRIEKRRSAHASLHIRQHGQTVVPWQLPKPGLQTHHNYYHTPKLVMWGSPVE